MKRTCAFISVLLACGCTAPSKEPNVNLAGYPPDFRAGYLDGCQSARQNDSPLKKSVQRFKSEPQYAAGWRDGHDICKREK